MLGGYYVYGLDAGVFKNNELVTSVVLPGSLEIIGEESFKNCVNLRSIRIPASVTRIEPGAFYGIEDLCVRFEGDPDDISYDLDGEPPFSPSATVIAKDSPTMRYLSEQIGFTFVPTFEWGRDNWNFTNSGGDFGVRSGVTTNRDIMSSKYLELLKNNVTNAEYVRLFKGFDDMKGTNRKAVLDETWGGYCQGMAALQVLALNGSINYSDFQSGASSLYSYSVPKNNSEIRSLIGYYYLLQDCRPYCAEKDRDKFNNSITNIENAINELDRKPCVVIAISSSKGSHAILGYDHEEGMWTVNGRDYTQRILVCDPNVSNKRNQLCDIYYNKEQKIWAIPYYTENSGMGIVNESTSRVLSSCGDADLLNARGVLSGTSAPKYIHSPQMFGMNTPGITYYRIASENTDRRINIDRDNWWSSLWWGNRYYDDVKMFPEKAGYFNYAVEYDDITLRANMENGNTSYFSAKDGSVSVEGKYSDYALQIVSDKDYPTKWFDFTIKGKSANAKLFKASDGYHLIADNFENLTIIAENKNDSDSFIAERYTYPYSADYSEVRIYLGTDGKVKMEGVTKKEAPTYGLGDVNMDLSVDAADASLVLAWYAKLSVGETLQVSAQAQALADVNQDTSIDASDASAILGYYSYLSTTSDKVKLTMTEYLKTVS